MPRLALVLPLFALAGAAAWAAHLVARRTTDVVLTGDFLPRWDLATHLEHGWTDYHLLVTGRLPALVWDLWSQGYWPPGLSLFQVPFYVLLGGGLRGGLWSSLVAFVMVAVCGAWMLLREEEGDEEGADDGADDGSGPIGASAFVALLVSSPFLLAYASVPMTEMLGALAQLVVLRCYQAWHHRQDSRRARLLALSLTALFFVKYNYFLLLAVPLLVHEWLERTAGWPVARRLAQGRASLSALARSPAAVGLVLYAVAALAVIATGGFEFRAFGQRVSVRSIGNSALVVFYALLLRLWYLHRRGRIDWDRIAALDPRIRPLLIWFAVPVAVWLASPYPNHLRDVANLVINRPMQDPPGAGFAAYLDSLITLYFMNAWLLGAVLAAFAVAVLRYRSQTPLMRLVIVAVLLQFAAIAVHQTRFPRFLLITVVLLCLSAAGEAGRWVSNRYGGLLRAGVAALALAAGVVAARQVVTETRFTAVAFENYTASTPLASAFEQLRRELPDGARLVFAGQSNTVSPALVRWELGPASGERCVPKPIGGAARLDPARATHVLLIEPLAPGPGLPDAPVVDAGRYAEVQREIERGAFVERRLLPLPDLNLRLSLYARPNEAAGRTCDS